MKLIGRYCFFSSLAQPKSKSKPPNGQQSSKDKISTKSDMCEFITIFIKRDIDVNTGDQKYLFF